MARDVLLDYVLKATAVEPIPQASKAYLHNVLVIVPLKAEQTAGIYECTDKAQVETYTDATAWQLFEAGMNKIYICAVDEYADAQALIDDTEFKFFTILIDKAFDTVPTEITGFAGVKGWTTTDKTKGKTFTTVATANNTSFIESADNTGLNMYQGFGVLLSASSWKNQQFIGMPEKGVTSNLGEAESYFDDRLSFVLNSEEFGNRLAFFVNRGRAIVAPYIYEEFQLDLKSWALTYINTNMPDYTDVEASKLQSYLTKKATEKYIATGLVETVIIKITADQSNFVMSGDLKISEPKATWRINATLQEGGLE